MPELPEVENLRLGLVKNILDQKILSVDVSKPKLISGKGTRRTISTSKKAEFIKGITAERIISIERRAKNLLFRLSHGKLLLVHLKMSGQFVYLPSHKASARRGKARGGEKVIGGHPIELSETTLPNKHSHVIFTLQNGMLYYNDTRMFGYLLYYPNAQAFEKENHFALYGVEPLSKEFTSTYLFDSLKKKTGKIKAVLMDQKIVTGLGNIYADESLFESKIRPDRKASSISKLEAKKLHKAIVRIIKRAVQLGGSSMATYRLLDNTRGNYGREHKVYGKDGEKCSTCGTPLKKIIVGGRTTIFCPTCQK